MGGPVLFEDLVGPKTSGDVQSLLHIMISLLFLTSFIYYVSLMKQRCLMKLLFMQTGSLQVPLFLCFVRLWG